MLSGPRPGMPVRAHTNMTIDDIVERLDSDSDGMLTFVELVCAIHNEDEGQNSLVSQLGREQLEILRSYFNKYDTDQSFSIHCSEKLALSWAVIYVPAQSMTSLPSKACSFHSRMWVHRNDACNSPKRAG